jgi:DNA repair photolyase
LARRSVVRTVDTPEFRGVTFYEVHAKSILNRVPPGSRMGFQWTLNPYRGCGHACVYCFARKTHTYLEFDAGHDFDNRLVVKVNAGELLRRELARPSWRGEHVAMGTNVDPYQRAEGRYRLMPEIISALGAAENPFSILTKGTLLLRDLDLLTEAAERTEVGLAVSVGLLDDHLWRSIEPGTPHPRRRLAMCASLREAGLDCAVLMAPILPFLSDSPSMLRATVAEIVDAGATSVTPIVLHLRPGAREWYMSWLERHHPELIPRYRALYGGGSYAPAWYQERVTGIVRDVARELGLGRHESPARHRGTTASAVATEDSSRDPARRRASEHSPPAAQLTLM